MKVEIKLFATLRRHLPDLAPGQGGVVDLPAAATGRDLLTVVKIPEEEAAIFLVNGRRQELSVPLHEGDRVSIFPPLGGGGATA
ncbi:MAG: MoaD/ThiS family protein [Firmicutes bacterium]|nr:MoaD/ThiS family protein [Bacillota bacterium]MCL5038464.1 MoaD/ThiS family protein [Bacillota bacterium]